jgi:hypothetical protein
MQGNQWFAAESLTRHAKGGPSRRVLCVPQPATGLEDLTDGKLREKPHCQDDPDHHFVGQCANPPGLLAGINECLRDQFGGNDLFESSDPI